MVTLNEDEHMKRIILTTCGTSLFQTSCWKYNGLNAKYPSQMENKHDRDAYEKKCETQLELARDGEKDIAPYFDRTPWDNLDYLRDLPAELAALRAIQVYFENHEPLGEEDKIILLHSDNEDGKYCAETIHKVLTNKKFSLLSKVRDIKLWEVPGLDPSNFKEFGDALKNIWHECIQRFPREENTQYIFNLTGGYKGTAILLGAFAYSKGKDTRIVYIHEETDYKTLSIMGFDNTKANEQDRFYADSADITNPSHRPLIGDPNTSR